MDSIKFQINIDDIHIHTGKIARTLLALFGSYDDVRDKSLDHFIYEHEETSNYRNALCIFLKFGADRGERYALEENIYTIYNNYELENMIRLAVACEFYVRVVNHINEMEKENKDNTIKLFGKGENNDKP